MLKRRAAATRGSHSARHPNGAVCSTGWNPAGTQYRCGHRGMERPTHPTPRQVLRSTCTVCDALRGGPGGRRGCGRGAHQAAGITSASKYGGSCAAPRAAVPNGRLAVQPRRQSPPARGPRVGQSTRACDALPPPPPRAATVPTRAPTLSLHAQHALRLALPLLRVQHAVVHFRVEHERIRASERPCPRGARVKQTARPTP